MGPDPGGSDFVEKKKIRPKWMNDNRLFIFLPRFLLESSDSKVNRLRFAETFNWLLIKVFFPRSWIPNDGKLQQLSKKFIKHQFFSCASCVGIVKTDAVTFSQTEIVLLLELEHYGLQSMKKISLYNYFTSWHRSLSSAKFWLFFKMGTLYLMSSSQPFCVIGF